MASRGALWVRLVLLVSLVGGRVTWWDEDADYEWTEIECPHVMEIEDRKIPLLTPERARRTTPKEFEVRTSIIPESGLGVLALTFVRRHTWLGEYEGDVKTVEEAEITNNDYAWEVPKGGRLHHYVDAIDPLVSNWLRYVNSARHFTEENIKSHVCHGRIFYRLTRDVAPGTELLVYYGDNYARRLGIDPDMYWKPISWRYCIDNN